MVFFPVVLILIIGDYVMVVSDVVGVAGGIEFFTVPNDPIDVYAAVVATMEWSEPMWYQNN